LFDPEFPILDQSLAGLVRKVLVDIGPPIGGERTRRENEDDSRSPSGFFHESFST
jgi:hypothetical protein